MIKAIIFDCFGVLAEDGWTPFKRKFLSHNLDLLLAVSRLGQEVDAGKRTYDDMIIETAKLVGIDESEVRNAVERKVPNEELFDYIKNELKQKYKIGMLSNASYNVLKHLFTEEQSKLFDATALSYELGLTKPDKNMYKAIAKRLEVNLNECLLVDDKPGHADGARDAGMQAVVYTSVPQLRAEFDVLLK